MQREGPVGAEYRGAWPGLSEGERDGGIQDEKERIRRREGDNKKERGR